MTLEAGQQLLHYRLIDKLGEGGMGIVWKAVDTELSREVAIKVLPEHFAEDPERLARFEREAKLLASLNHRNIAAIYGLTQAPAPAPETGSVRFLVMELVDGEDLAQRLSRGAIPSAEAVDIGLQLARALEAAHDKGVLHRDLKPANVQLTEEGRVKVLDFGLAKEFHVEGEQSHSPTLTSGGTQAGAILGTAAYMSPEQARGRAVDKRGDVWAFGCVLYECLTGRSAFGGETLSDTLAGVLKSEPNWAVLPDETPPRVRELLHRCLQKDLKNRLRDAGDARLELQAVARGQEASITSGVGFPAVAEEPGRRRFAMPFLLAALALVLVGGAALWTTFPGLRPSTGAGIADVARLSIAFPDDLRVDGFAALPGEEPAVLLIGVPKSAAPEDRAPRSFLRRYGDYKATPIPGTEGQRAVAYSPDGRWLALLKPVAPNSTNSRLWKVSLDGSAPPLALLDWPEDWYPNFLLWLPSGELLALAIEPQALVRVPANGSPPRDPVEIRPVGFEGNFWYSGYQGTILPDGIHVLGTAVTYGERGYDNSVALANVETGELRLLVENGSFPQYRDSGHLLFARGPTLLATPFDLESLTVNGAQVAITDGLRTGVVWGDGAFDVTSGGALLHLPGGLIGGNRRIFAVSRDYEVLEPWSDERRAFENSLVVSDQGKRLAVTVANSEGLYDTWASDVERPRLIRLVHEPGTDCWPQLWMPDEERLVYNCNTTEMQSLRVRPFDSSEPPEVLLDSGSGSEWWLATAVLRDGSTLLLTHFVGNDVALELLSLEPGSDGKRSPEPLVADAGWGRLSPDGKWLAYASRASGRDEVYLRSVGPSGSLGREIPVTRDGCTLPIWARGERAAPLEIWANCQSRIFSLTVTTTDGVRISEPELVFDATDFFATLKTGNAFLPDGSQLAALEGEDETPPSTLNIVLNWEVELRERLAASR